MIWVVLETNGTDFIRCENETHAAKTARNLAERVGTASYYKVIEVGTFDRVITKRTTDGLEVATEAK